MASDALRTLQRAVGQDVDCPDWICDVNDNGSVAAGDSLNILKAAVAAPVILRCGDPTALVLRMFSGKLLGALQLDIDYLDVLASIPGDGLTVHCQSLVPGATAVFNNLPSRVLSVGVVNLDGFSGPRSLARCELTPAANVEPEHFGISVKDATDLKGLPVLDVQVKALPY